MWMLLWVTRQQSWSGARHAGEERINWFSARCSLSRLVYQQAPLEECLPGPVEQGMDRLVDMDGVRKDSPGDHSRPLQPWGPKISNI